MSSGMMDLVILRAHSSTTTVICATSWMWMTPHIGCLLLHRRGMKRPPKNRMPPPFSLWSEVPCRFGRGRNDRLCHHRTPVRSRALPTLGATFSASHHAWGRSAAYACQFLDLIGQAWRTRKKVAARLIGDDDPDEWDLLPRPKGMRWK